MTSHTAAPNRREGEATPTDFFRARVRVRVRATEPWMVASVAPSTPRSSGALVRSRREVHIAVGGLLEVELSTAESRQVGFCRVVEVHDAYTRRVGRPVGLRSADRRLSPRIQVGGKLCVSFVSGGQAVPVVDLSPQGLRLLVAPPHIDALTERGLRGMLRLPDGNAVRVLVEARHRATSARPGDQGRVQVGCRFVGLGPVERADIAAAVDACSLG